jgi:hypothetical protein
MLAVAVSGRPALAHEERDVGDLSVEAGWMEEPVFTGLRNAVQFIATDAASGQPVEGGDLQVVVIFGPKEGSEQTDPMPLSRWRSCAVSRRRTAWPPHPRMRSGGSGISVRSTGSMPISAGTGGCGQRRTEPS